MSKSLNAGNLVWKWWLHQKEKAGDIKADREIQILLFLIVCLSLTIASFTHMQNLAATHNPARLTLLTPALIAGLCTTHIAWKFIVLTGYAVYEFKQKTMATLLSRKTTLVLMTLTVGIVLATVSVSPSHLLKTNVQIATMWMPLMGVLMIFVSSFLFEARQSTTKKNKNKHSTNNPAQ